MLPEGVLSATEISGVCFTLHRETELFMWQTPDGERVLGGDTIQAALRGLARNGMILAEEYTRRKVTPERHPVCTATWEDVTFQLVLEGVVLRWLDPDRQVVIDGCLNEQHARMRLASAAPRLVEEYKARRTD